MLNDKAERLPLNRHTCTSPPASPGGMGRRASFIQSLVNVPICFPECSKEEFIGMLCGCGQQLIKWVFFVFFPEIQLIGHSRDIELAEEEDSWPQLSWQFADVY